MDRRWLAEVWTGDNWLTLGLYKSKKWADKRVKASKSNQEHRVRICPANEYWHEQNLLIRTSNEKRKLRELF